MRFFCGLHQPSDAQHFAAAFISVNRLRGKYGRKRPFPVGDWIMDSGAFTEISTHGHYRHSVAEYAADIRRWATNGRLLAAVAQDWMCEPWIVAKTGLSVAEHQRLTVERYDALRAEDTAGVYILPVLQGYAPEEYVAHLALYGDRLAPGAWVGVGSICKRNGNPRAIEAVLSAIKAVRPDLRLHGFGLKTTALRSAAVCALLYSADSMAWSFAARREGRNQNDWREAKRWVASIDAVVNEHTGGRVAAVQTGTRILEFDYSGIEQVVMGWLMAAPQYIRIAKLGTHALVASHVLGRPADLTWPDAQLAAYFKEIKGGKGETYVIYDRSKRCVHGTAYGLTVHGMVRQFPKSFPDLKSAQRIQDVYFGVAPTVPAFQAAVQRTAYEQHFLGGASTYQYDVAAKRVTGHPYAYKHTFYSVLTYTRLSESQRLWREKRKMPLTEIAGIWYGIDLGEDAKRVIAYYPQSTARGVLTEAALDLFLPDDHHGHRADLYVGDAYYGRTPLRAPIHDSLLLEVPVRAVDRVAERVFAAMQAPVEELPCPAEWGIGAYLTIGVDGKIGMDWDKQSMEALHPPSVASDVTVFGDEQEDQEDVDDLGVAVA